MSILYIIFVYFMHHLCLFYASFTSYVLSVLCVADVIKANKVTKSRSNAEAFVLCCALTRGFLHILKKRELSLNDLERLDNYAKRIGMALAESQTDLKKPLDLNIPKVHSLVHFR